MIENEKITPSQFGLAIASLVVGVLVAVFAVPAFLYGQSLIGVLPFAIVAGVCGYLGRKSALGTAGLVLGILAVVEVFGAFGYLEIKQMVEENARRQEELEARQAEEIRTKETNERKRQAEQAHLDEARLNAEVRKAQIEADTKLREAQIEADAKLHEAQIAARKEIIMNGGPVEVPPSPPEETKPETDSPLIVESNKDNPANINDPKELARYIKKGMAELEKNHNTGAILNQRNIDLHQKGSAEQLLQNKKDLATNQAEKNDILQKYRPYSQRLYKLDAGYRDFTVLSRLVTGETKTPDKHHNYGQYNPLSDLR